MMFTPFLCLCLLSVPLFATTTPPIPSPKEIVRDALTILDEEMRTFIFYHSTFPVEGLDPALWRQDQNGQLLLATLSSCTGCLCYSFDHRYPVSLIREEWLRNQQTKEQIQELMMSPYNMQAVVYRANRFKSNLHEDDLTNGMMESFGCDQDTMQHFYDEDFKQTKLVGSLLVNDFNIKLHQERYKKYLNDADIHENQIQDCLRISETEKRLNPDKVRDELRERARTIAISVTTLEFQR